MAVTTTVERLERDEGGLTDEQRLAAVMADAPELAVLLSDLQHTLAEVRSHVGPVLKEVLLYRSSVLRLHDDENQVACMETRCMRIKVQRMQMKTHDFGTLFSLRSCQVDLCSHMQGMPASIAFNCPFSTSFSQGTRAAIA